MSSRIYNPFPFQRRFPLTTDAEHEAGPNEIVSPPKSNSMVNINTQFSKRVSPTSPRLFSPVPYSRHCNSYSPVNWKNPSEDSSLTEPDTEVKGLDDGQNPIVTKNVEEKAVDRECMNGGKSSDEQDEYLELKIIVDSQITTECQCLGEEKINNINDELISSEEPVDFESVDGQNPTKSISSDEWLIDRHSPVDIKLLLEEWTRKRSEDYQKTLKRPLTAIPEEEYDKSTSNTTHNDKGK